MLLSLRDSSLTILCISPVNIKNLNFGLDYKDDALNRYFRVEQAEIPVRCGHCPECVKTSQLEFVQRLQMESLENYLFFATLTYNNESIPSVVTSSGYTIKFADWHDLQNLFKRMRNTGFLHRNFRYLAVSERGSQRGRPHFHVLFLVKKLQSDDIYTPLNLQSKLYDFVFRNWSRNIGSKRKPIYKPLFTYQRKRIDGRVYQNFDLHYCVPSNDDALSSVAFYVTKYMLKPSDKDNRLQQALRLNLPPEEYEDVWKLVKSRVDSSLYLGLSPDTNNVPSEKIVSYIKECIRKSDKFPQFFSLSDGSSFPLARYYRKFMTLSDCLRLSDFEAYNDKSYMELIKKSNEYKENNPILQRGDFDSVCALFD